MSEQNVQTRPLQGKRVLVTRTREQAHLLSERLQALGASPVEFPTIHIVPPSNWETLDTALGKLFLAATQQQPYYSRLVFLRPRNLPLMVSLRLLCKMRKIGF